MSEHRSPARRRFRRLAAVAAVLSLCAGAGLWLAGSASADIGGFTVNVDGGPSITVKQEGTTEVGFCARPITDLQLYVSNEHRTASKTWWDGACDEITLGVKATAEWKSPTEAVVTVWMLLRYERCTRIPVIETVWDCKQVDDITDPADSRITTDEDSEEWATPINVVPGGAVRSGNEYEYYTRIAFSTSR